MELKQEHIGNIVRESYGIVYRRYCIKCGRNLPLFEFDCPYCSKKQENEHGKRV